LDGILYPLLANLYLTPFDEYVDKLNFTVSNNSLSLAPHVSYPGASTGVAGEDSSPDRGLNKKKFIFFDSLHPSEKLRKISYVRFGDKFLVGINGSYKDAVIIRNLLTDFLEKELGLTIKKTSRAMNEVEAASRTGLVSKVESLCSNYVEFLGYSIRVTESRMLRSNKFITGQGLKTSHAAATPSNPKGTLSLGSRDQVLIKLIVSRKVIKE
jgi:hypothetical protein